VTGDAGERPEVIELRPIGVIEGGRRVPDADGWDAEVCEVVLDAERFDASALAGLAEFSHVEVVFHFHLVDEADVVAGARHPRGRTDWPAVGIFAQRGRVRPNRLGVSVARLLTVDGLRVTVRGLDAVDGTPVLDLKPYLRGFAPRGEVVEPAWAREIMDGYWDGPSLDNP
jgi:tRNA-Thr(GGU) m(6)t(6)A37 methyltransferase TsaA